MADQLNTITGFWLTGHSVPTGHCSVSMFIALSVVRFSLDV